MQKPLPHWPPAVQGLPMVFARLPQVPAPSHDRPCVSVETQAGAPIGSSLPDGTKEHVPRVATRLQVLQVSLQSVLQQTPSAQWPLAHSPNASHCWPRRFLHCWLASHAWSDGQLSSPDPTGTLRHLPAMPGTLHDLHVPVQVACSQQTPSTQKPDAQLEALAAEQPDPLMRGAVLARYSQISCGPYVESPVTLPPKTSVVALSESKIWRWL